jgi:hypothetical protein
MNEAIMSYTITLRCGCVVYVSCHPETHIAHTRVIESRGAGCAERRHDRGVRVFLWELLPQRVDGIGEAPAKRSAG